jgi:hypothetical protein
LSLLHSCDILFTALSEVLLAHPSDSLGSDIGVILLSLITTSIKSSILYDRHRQLLLTHNG